MQPTENRLRRGRVFSGARGPLHHVYHRAATARMRFLRPTGIDLNTTYIGGPARLIEDLLAANHMEVWPAEPDDDITYKADTLNAG